MGCGSYFSTSDGLSDLIPIQLEIPGSHLEVLVKATHTTSVVITLYLLKEVT